MIIYGVAGAHLVNILALADCIKYKGVSYPQNMLTGIAHTPSSAELAQSVQVKQDRIHNATHLMESSRILLSLLALFPTNALFIDQQSLQKYLDDSLLYVHALLLTAEITGRQQANPTAHCRALPTYCYLLS